MVATAEYQNPAALETGLPRANVRDWQNAFPEDEFVNLPNVPVFAEHSTTSSKGRPLRYTRAELEAVCRRCNQRIIDTGDYAAITDGHTPDDEERAAGAKMPDVLGFAGPFKLGVIGEGQRARYAILADFHIFKDSWPRAKRLPRRSPEVWLEERYADQFLDPIALLGAEAPRLDMGLFYMARARNGAVIEKYSAAAPGMANTFIPTDDNRKNYQGGDAPSEGDSSMALPPEDIRQIVEAIQQLPVFQWAEAQMQKSGEVEHPDAGAGAPGPGELEQPGGPPAPAGNGAPPAPNGNGAPKTPPEPAGGPPEEDREAMRRSYMADPDEEEEEEYCGKRYSAGGSADDEGNNKPPPGVVEGPAAPPARPAAGHVDGGGNQTGKYARNPRDREIYRMKKQMDAMASQLEAERAQRINAERREVLIDLRHSRNFDLEAEIERTKYQRMPKDDDFQEHLSIMQNYERIPAGAEAPFPLPNPNDGPPRPTLRDPAETGTSRYGARYSQKALEIAEAKALAGEHVDYERILEEVHSGNGA